MWVRHKFGNETPVVDSEGDMVAGKTRFAVEVLVDGEEGEVWIHGKQEAVMELGERGWEVEWGSDFIECETYPDIEGIARGACQHFGIAWGNEIPGTEEGGCQVEGRDERIQVEVRIAWRDGLPKVCERAARETMGLWHGLQPASGYPASETVQCWRGEDRESGDSMELRRLREVDGERHAAVKVEAGRGRVLRTLHEITAGPG